MKGREEISEAEGVREEGEGVSINKLSSFAIQSTISSPVILATIAADRLLLWVGATRPRLEGR